MNHLSTLLSKMYASACVAMCAMLLLSGTLAAQDASRALYDDLEKFEQLSGAAQNMLRAQFGPRPGERIPDYRPMSDNGPVDEVAPLLALHQGGGWIPFQMTTLVNNAAADATAQDTQSETAIILGSGSNVIAGFNDSGSLIGPGANKFTGYSTSTDGGTTWVDGGTLPTNAFGDAGDPVLARDNTSGRIYFATLQFTSNGMQLFRSDDDGATWMAPTQCAPGATGFQDKEWITVDNFAGSGQGNVYHAYRDFAAGGGIRFTKSTDAGATFAPSPGLLLKEGSLSNVQGAQVAVGSDHSVYVFWYDQHFTPREIRMSKSTDQGATFGPEVSVTTLTSTVTNGGLTLTAGFRSNSFPQVVVNEVNGDLYVVYNDPTAISGGDRGNIFFRQSTDDGVTWSTAVQLNDDGTTRAQYMPAIAVKPDGSGLAVTWYDNRSDPADINIERWGVTATIAGSTVTFGTNFQVGQQFTPVFGVDPVVNSVYMGDYDMMAADNTNFYSTWADNRDQSIAVPARKNANIRFVSFPLGGPVPTAELVMTSRTLTGGNGNGSIDQNECNDLTFTVRNDGLATATAISGTLSTTTPGVTITTATQPFGTLAVGASDASTFKVSTAPGLGCVTIDFILTLSYTEGSDVLPFSLPTCQTLPTSIASTLGSPTPGVGYTVTTGLQTLRLTRDGVPSTCASPKPACPGVFATTGTRVFDAYTFTNGLASACVTITLTQNTGTANAFFSTSYLGSFVPATVCINYLADAGASGPTSTYQAVVPANGTLVVVVHEVNAAGGAGATYTVNVSGLSSSDPDGGGGCELTAAPTVDSPIASGATSVNGTSTEADGTVIDVFVNSSSVGTTTVTGGLWTKGGLLSAKSGPSIGLVAGDTVKATATASGETESPFSNEVIVQDVTTAPVVTSPIIAGATSVSGTGPEAIATKATGLGTLITVYVNSNSVGVTNVIAGGSWTLSGMAVLSAGDTVKATATATDKLTSAFSNEVIVNAAPGTSDAPVVNSPIASGSTSISGTSTEADGTVIDVFVNSSSVGTTTVTGSLWTKGGLLSAKSGPSIGLVAGDTVKATATASGETESPFSNEVVVQDVTTAPVVTSPIVAGATSVSGTGPETIFTTGKGPKAPLAGGTVIEVFKNSVSVGTTGVNAGGSWTKSGLAALAAGDTVKAKATAFFKLPSAFSNEVIVEAAPVFHKFIVTNTDDAGAGSLRQAILDANATANINASTPDTICFNIAGAGPHTIAPGSALPTVTDPVIIDGYSQPGSSKNTLALGNDAVLKIILSGANAPVPDANAKTGTNTAEGVSTNGLTITAGNSTVQGLVINGFSGFGILIQTNGNNIIRGNFIGTDIAGTTDLGNGSTGVSLSGSSSNTIGGSTAADRNVISGNATGIIIASTSGNLIAGNYIGTDASGTADLGNNVFGVSISSSSSDTIGGPTAGERNVISGNGAAGIRLSGGASNIVVGNYIGTDATGTADLGNGSAGVEIISTGTGNKIGGMTPGERNVISGNDEEGILMNSGATGNHVLGNYIGTDITGTADLGNSLAGVHISNTHGNTIGGSTAGERNVISGNGNDGVFIRIAAATGNIVKGNYIGTNASGTGALGNGFSGVNVFDAPANTIGGTTAGERNIISGNNNNGVLLVGSGSESNIVKGNYIGTDITGTANLGNGFHGVIITGASNNTVGGTDANTGNTIAFNGGAGVSVSTGTENAIDPNSIFSNGGLGIDLGTAGVTPNDAGDGDTGANNLQNFPEMILAQREGNGDLSVTYSVPSTIINSAYPLHIEFFKTDDGEGKTFLGAQSYAAPGAVTQTFTPAVAVTAGDNVVATATDDNGNTSEFAAIIIVTAPPAANVLQNPGFESGTSPWVFFTNGTGNLSVIGPGPSSPNAARVAINTTGNNMQLYQAGITLLPNTQYRLTFKALSSIGHNLAVFLHRHVAPFTNYGLNGQVFDLTPSWATYTVDFTTVGFPPPTPSNGRLRFAFNGHASPGDVYFIDDVTLEVLGSPLTATKVRVETAPDGGGSVVPAQTIENGETITMYAISRTATDQFVANVSAAWSLQNIVPNVVAGDLVASGDGKSAVFTGNADGSARVQAISGALTPVLSNVITVFTPPPVTNLLVNGGFESGTTNWLFNTNGVGSFTAVTPGNVGAKAGQVAINTQGSIVQLYQFGVTLTSGNTYRLSFRAFSNTGHDIQASVFKHGSPFTAYGLTNQFFNLTNTWASYSVDFTASGFVGTVSDARLRFWFAPYDVAGDIYQFDDVKLELVPAPSVAGIHNPQSEIPAEFTLTQNFPNPFNPSTTILYTLPVDARVTLDVYDVLGRRVAQLVDGTITAGYHDAVFNASDLASGLYLYRLTAVGADGVLFTRTEKMLLTK